MSVAELLAQIEACAEKYRCELGCTRVGLVHVLLAIATTKKGLLEELFFQDGLDVHSCRRSLPQLTPAEAAGDALAYRVFIAKSASQAEMSGLRTLLRETLLDSEATSEILRQQGVEVDLLRRALNATRVRPLPRVPPPELAFAVDHMHDNEVAILVEHFVSLARLASRASEAGNVELANDLLADSSELRSLLRTQLVSKC